MQLPQTPGGVLPRPKSLEKFLPCRKKEREGGKRRGRSLGPLEIIFSNSFRASLFGRDNAGTGSSNFLACPPRRLVGCVCDRPEHHDPGQFFRTIGRSSNLSPKSSAGTNAIRLSGNACCDHASVCQNGVADGQVGDWAFENFIGFQNVERQHFSASRFQGKHID